MKRILCIGFPVAVLFFCSCKNNKEPAIQPVPGEQTQLQILKQDISKYPDSLLLVEKLIQAYRDMGDYDSAIAITNRTIKRLPGVAGLWDIKGMLHFENEDTVNAINSFEKAISIFPSPEYVMSLGALYAETKNPRALVMANALEMSDKAQAKKEAFFIRGLYYNYINDKKKAIALFDSCIRVDYTYMFAYKGKAIALYDQGKYEEALKVLDRAVTVQNNFDEGYFWMGNCYRKLNKKEEAINSYKRALMYDKDYFEARDSLNTIGDGQ